MKRQGHTKLGQVTGHKRVRRETIKERLGMGRGNSGGNRVCNAGQERRGIEKKGRTGSKIRNQVEKGY